MTKPTLRMTVDYGSDNADVAYLRLGRYVPGETGLPSNFTRGLESSDGILMSTDGDVTIVAAEESYAQSAASLNIQVVKGAFALEADSSLELTSRSVFLQSGYVVDENSDVPSVPDGTVQIKTSEAFKARSKTGNVTLKCPAAGLKKTIHSGFVEVFGNQESSGGNSTSITLAAATSVTIGVAPFFVFLSAIVRGAETGTSLLMSGATAVDSTAIGKELDSKSLKNGIDAIKSSNILARIKQSLADATDVFSDLDFSNIDITQGDIDADLFGVESRVNSTAEINI
ncbi:hypothetical protein [Amorphus orientalis]|uniref:Uncharacterized protein n=1 Tax=Amorphus orientalis TaxID=649198 RepID=A0AAE4ARJ7_9HYPH|nr:hypothetical protein [Amorphus orientalis]MDQ0314277.1 hypothetical protein [Amorphus orientalis]